jgi:hypothetical protein
MKRILIFILPICILTGCQFKPKYNPDITPTDVLNHIAYLASDSLGGRYPGTRGDSLAAGYIRAAFHEYGLQLQGEEGYQYFEAVTGAELGEGNFFRFNDNELVIGQNFTPYSFSENGTFTGELVFAGYGFDISEDSIHWQDYEGVDVTGKIGRAHV